MPNLLRSVPGSRPTFSQDGAIAWQAAAAAVAVRWPAVEEFADSFRVPRRRVLDPRYLAAPMDAWLLPTLTAQRWAAIKHLGDAFRVPGRRSLDPRYLERPSDAPMVSYQARLDVATWFPAIDAQVRAPQVLPRRRRWAVTDSGFVKGPITFLSTSAVTATGVATFAATSVFVVTRAIVAAGVATLTLQTQKILAATATGVTTLATAAHFLVTVAVTATGVVTTTAHAIFALAPQVVQAVGVATLETATGVVSSLMAWFHHFFKGE